jgi:hypothetical protein
MKKHWLTTTLGTCAILLGAWSFHVHWISYQSLYFNLVYGEVPSIGLIFAGWIGIHAADGRHVK